MTKFIAYLLLILTIIILLFLAWQPSWYSHLHFDIDIFYARSTFFIKNLSLHKIDVNEYQPGALLFFVILSPILLFSNSLNTFTWIMFITNSLLVFLTAYLYQKIANYKSIFIYSLILLITGPIIFYRFELLVISFVLLSIYSWIKNRDSLSAVFLAVATLIKIYPLILLPYFLIKKLQSNIFNCINYLLIYLVTIIIFLITFSLIFQTDLSDLYTALNYHTQKSVSLESSWGTLISLFHKIVYNRLPPAEVNYKVWSLNRNFIFAPLWFYNYFWILPISALYIKLLINSSAKKLDIYFLLILILTFLITSKTFVPQYLLWFNLLIPLIGSSLFTKKFYMFSFILILTITFLTPYIYPLSYSKLIDGYIKGYLTQIFWINGLRNLLMILLAIVLYKNLKFKQTNNL